MAEVITAKFEFSVDGLAEELRANARDLERLRAIMARIRADHGSDVLRRAAWRATRELTRGIMAAVDLYDNLQWTIGVEIGPDPRGGCTINSITRHAFDPDHPPRPRWELFGLDRG